MSTIVSFSVEVEISGVSADVAEKLKKEFEGRTFIALEDTISSIEAEIEGEIPEEFQDSAQIEAEAKEYFLTDDQDTLFVVADFRGKMLAEAEEMLEAEEEHGNAYVIWMHEIGSIDVKDFEEDYQGEYDSEAAFAEQLVGDVEDVSNIPSYLYNCIDWARVWSYGLHFDYWTEDGHFFRNN